MFPAVGVWSTAIDKIVAHAQIVPNFMNQGLFHHQRFYIINVNIFLNISCHMINIDDILLKYDFKIAITSAVSTIPLLGPRVKLTFRNDRLSQAVPIPAATPEQLPRLLIHAYKSTFGSFNLLASLTRSLIPLQHSRVLSR